MLLTEYTYNSNNAFFSSEFSITNNFTLSIDSEWGRCRNVSLKKKTSGKVGECSDHVTAGKIKAVEK